MKRFLAILLSVALLLGLCACGGTTDQPDDSTGNESAAATLPQEPKTLKVLTLGHSLAVDAGHMLALIAAAEGYDGLKVGTLYYSGCRLSQHLKFLENDEPVYKLYLSDSSKPSTPTITSDITMKSALRFDNWDVIVMQDGAWESAEDEQYKDGELEKIQAYVNEHKLNPNAVFAWHMYWVYPTDPELQAMHPNDPNPITEGYVAYGNDRTTLFNAVTECVKNNILTNETFATVIPSGTAIENAHTTYMGDRDLYRDYAHASDFGRVIAGYVWYCTLLGIDHLDDIKLTGIPKAYFQSNSGMQDVEFTQLDKDIILESVNNALKNPYQITQSQYTEAPEGYVAN